MTQSGDTIVACEEEEVTPGTVIKGSLPMTYLHYLPPQLQRWNDGCPSSDAAQVTGWHINMQPGPGDNILWKLWHSVARRSPSASSHCLIHITYLSTIYYLQGYTEHGMSPECSCPSARYLLVVWSDCFTKCSVPGGKWAVKAKRVSA